MAVPEEFLKGAAAPCTSLTLSKLSLFFFLFPSNNLFHAKDDAALHLQNVATTAPSRFNKVSLYAPSPNAGEFLVNQQIVTSLGSKTAASNLFQTLIDLHLKKNDSLYSFFFPLSQSCVSSFLFFSFPSSLVLCQHGKTTHQPGEPQSATSVKHHQASPS